MTHPFRICTWNIQLGLQLDTILAAIETEADFSGLDLLALQEASLHDQVEDAFRIAEALGPTYDYFQVTAQLLGEAPQANALVWNT